MYTKMQVFQAAEKRETGPITTPPRTSGISRPIEANARRSFRDFRAGASTLVMEIGSQEIFFGKFAGKRPT